MLFTLLYRHIKKMERTHGTERALKWTHGMERALEQTHGMERALERTLCFLSEVFLDLFIFMLSCFYCVSVC